ncbi:MAG: carbohydrate-binding protein [Eubacteriales bacterium]
MLRERRRCEALQAKQERIESASTIAFVTLAENGSIDEVTAAEHSDSFSPWGSDIPYPAGALRRYNGELFKCIQEHLSQSDWTPDKTPALWVKIGDPTVEFPEWSQPIGAHDAYNTGDKVSHNSRRWVSTVDANIWEPGIYGWEEVE